MKLILKNKLDNYKIFLTDFNEVESYILNLERKNE